MTFLQTFKNLRNEALNDDPLLKDTNLKNLDHEDNENSLKNSEAFKVPTTPLDSTISKIGFGKFQFQMLVLCGLGWLADNMWLQCVAVILPRVQRHFSVSPAFIGILSSSIFTGMMGGSLFWGLFSDFKGRKSAFNWTLAVSAFFGILASLAPTFSSLCLCLLCLGFGVGGNMPVDGALFLEFIPKESQHLLTFLSVFFSFGAVLTSFLAYLILPTTSCKVIAEPTETCDVDLENNGWRYLLLALGILNLLMVVSRVLLFHLPESPKFLMAQNRPDDVVLVLRKIVRINGSRLSINLKDIQTQNGLDYATLSPNQFNSSSPNSSFANEDNTEDEYLPDSSSPFTSLKPTWDRVVPILFGRRYLLTTILVWIIWTLTSFAYTMFNVYLPKYLEDKGSSEDSTLSQVYASALIYSLCGIPGSIIGSYLVETPLGRKGSMALSTFGSALGLLTFVLSSTPSGMLLSSGFVNFLATIMYAVIYAYTPEVFSPQVRGTASGIASALSRISGILAPLITGYLLTLNASLPNILSVSMFIFVGFCMLALPIETRGRNN